LVQVNEGSGLGHGGRWRREKERERERERAGEGEGGGGRLRETNSEDGQDSHEGLMFRVDDFGVPSLPPSPSCLMRCCIVSRIGNSKSQPLKLNLQILPLSLHPPAGQAIEVEAEVPCVQ
jgi:hypothetical protein